MKDRQVDAVIGALSGNGVFIRLPTGYEKTIKTAVLPHALDILHFAGKKCFIGQIYGKVLEPLKQICQIFKQQSDTQSSFCFAFSSLC